MRQYEPTKLEPILPKWITKNIIMPFLIVYGTATLVWNVYDFGCTTRRLEEGQTRAEIERIIETGEDLTNQVHKKFFPIIGDDIAYLVYDKQD